MAPKKNIAIRRALKRPRAVEELHNDPASLAPTSFAASVPFAAVAELKELRSSLESLQANVQKERVNSDAKCKNSMVRGPEQKLHPLLTPSGAVPPHFPATRKALWEMSGPQLTSLLELYERKVPLEVHERRRAFAEVIGAWL